MTNPEQPEAGRARYYELSVFPEDIAIPEEAILTLWQGIGLTRILVWQGVWHTYGVHYMLVALTVACSLIGVVLFGTLAGSMLPFILRRAGLDPASASAPFVATLVDVTGLVIYFTVASIIMRGTLL